MSFLTTVSPSSLFGDTLKLLHGTPGLPEHQPRLRRTRLVLARRSIRLLAAKFSDSRLVHFDLDHLGSVRQETDANGAVIKYRDFWPYGEEATTPAGRLCEKESKLSHGTNALRLSYASLESGLGASNGSI